MVAFDPASEAALEASEAFDMAEGLKVVLKSPMFLFQ
jgi:hypothetical protein